LKVIAEQAKGALYSSIVVGTDGSETASKAVSRAAELAAASSATLSIVSAFRPVPPERLRNERAGAPDDIAYVVNSREDVDHLLSVAKKLAQSIGANSVRTEAVDSDPSEALIDVAERVSADLIVVGSKGMTGAKRFILGSVPNRVAHHTPCDVLIVKTDPGPGESKDI
jgi:nucleotide-binding universal stress UspA family protein